MFIHAKQIISIGASFDTFKALLNEIHFHLEYRHRVQGSGWKMHNIQSLNVERHHENMHAFFSYRKSYVFFIKLDIIHMAYGSPIHANIQYACKKCQSIYIFG